MSITKDAVECFGADNQIIKAIEELSELQHALSKELVGDGSLDNIAEEMADVQIMLAQLLHIFDNHDQVAYHMERKLKRLRRRVREEL